MSRQPTQSIADRIHLSANRKFKGCTPAAGIEERVATMDMAENNFPKSGYLSNSAIVPAREEVIEGDPHGIDKVFSILLSRDIDSA